MNSLLVSELSSFPCLKETWEILKRFLMQVLSTRVKRKKNTPENVGMGFSFFFN